MKRETRDTLIWTLAFYLSVMGLALAASIGAEIQQSHSREAVSNAFGMGR